MKVYIVIAAYNEEKKISEVVEGLKKERYQNIVVVDDGSRDKTYEVAEKAGAEVLRHLVNRGQGAGLQTGIDYALKKGADAIVTFDADGQHDPRDVKRVLKPVINKEADVVFGSRFLGKSNVPFFKKLTLKGAIFFTWIFSGVWLTDAHCGFRALSRDAAKKIRITYDKMEHASEIVDEVMTKKIKYKEVPVNVRYTEYSIRKGQSVFNSIKIATRLLMGRFLR